MQNANLRNKLYLYRLKISLFVLALFFGQDLLAQKKKWVDENLPGYDQKKIHYGFSLAYHSSFNRILLADEFENIPNLAAINTKASPGFSIGFMVSNSFADFWELRFHPAVAFYENRIDYHYSAPNGGNPSIRNELMEGTRLELPLLLKFRSNRNGNTRMYLIGGVRPSIEAGKRKDESSSLEQIELNRNDFAIDFGFGWEQYFNFFKFSPEIRFSHGIPNLLKSRDNDLTRGLERVTYNSVTLYLNFQ